MTRRLLLALVALAVAATLRAAGPIQMSQSKYIFQEGSGTGTVTVLRTGPTGGYLSLRYIWNWYNGPGVDGFLTFNPGETQKTITIAIPNDNVYTWYQDWPGLDGSIAVYDPVVGGSGADTRAELLAMDDDPVPTITGDTITITEGNGGSQQVILHFKLSAPLGPSWYTPGFFTYGGNADANEASPRYTVTSSLLGATDFALQFTIKGDLDPEPDETFVVTMHIGTPEHEVGSGQATINILNDDYSLTPKGQRIELGKSGTITFMTGGGPLAPERYSVSSSDPSIASVPPFIDVAPGQSQATIPVTTHAIGLVTISLGMPVNRGGVTLNSDVTVFQQSALGLDRGAVTLPLGSQTTIKATLDPPPLVPLTLLITNNRPSIVDTPFSFVVGTEGKGTFNVRGVGVGSASILIPLTAEYGGGSSSLVVEVSQPAGLAITSFSSKSGPTTGDQQVKLFGTNMKGRCTVTFGGTSAINTALVSAGSVTTSTPPHAAGTVDVTIRCGTEEFTFANAYTYVAAAPRLTRIAPTAGAAEGGTIVVATGENLPRGRCGLLFGNAPATTVLNQQGTEMTVIAPAHAAGIVPVTLRCGADSSAINDAYLFGGDDPVAQIEAVTPSSAAPGERVQIGGARFRFSDLVSFGAVSALDMTTTPAAHTVTVPEMAAGPLTITLRDANGRTITGPSFTVKPPVAPLITSAPAKVTAGAEFVVNGAGFRPSLSFVVAGATLHPIVLAPTFAVLRVPAATTPQSTNLTLQDGGTTVASRAIEVIATGISVESATPSCLSTDGGALVTIHGSGFEPGAVVTFGAADGTAVEVRDAHTIIARAPASSGVNDATITVINPAGDSGTLTGGFAYRWPDSACGPPRHRPSRH